MARGKEWAAPPQKAPHFPQRHHGEAEKVEPPAGTVPGRDLAARRRGAGPLPPPFPSARQAHAGCERMSLTPAGSGLAPATTRQHHSPPLGRAAPQRSGPSPLVRGGGGRGGRLGTSGASGALQGLCQPERLPLLSSAHQAPRPVGLSKGASPPATPPACRRVSGGAPPPPRGGRWRPATTRRHPLPPLGARCGW